jgi:hypothetical protein
VNVETLTQAQEAAVSYNMRSSRPNDHRVKRKTTRIVRSFCEAHGFPAEAIPAIVRDMWDHVELERLAAGYRLRGGRWVYIG